MVQVPLEEHIPVTVCAAYRKSRDSAFLQEVLRLLTEEAVALAKP
ncbi:hypothetical protein [Gordonibacter sp. An230]|nr:hypothetical protein [Gordonibacter sp. An230]